jgi:hypothetical protein
LRQDVDVATDRRVVMRPLTWALIVLALVLFAVAVVYFTTAAKDLPAFFPGHTTGSTKTHTKHGLVFVGLGVIALIGAWFTTAPKDDPAGS